MDKLCLFVSAAALVCGCTADLNDRIDALEKRVEALEAKVNSNAEGISTLVAAAEKAVTITNVEETEDGYITFISATILKPKSAMERTERTAFLLSSEFPKWTVSITGP